MPRVCHIVTTSAFAGVERYVCAVAAATADRGWDVVVIGGDPKQMVMALGDRARWWPGSGLLEAVRSVARSGGTDICHAHMTKAEALSVALRPIHRGRVVATRHFAAARGKTMPGRLLAPWITAGIAREFAASQFVADQLDPAPAAVLRLPVAASPCLWRKENRVVLVLQRLEPEKDTETAMRVWQASGLANEGWTMRIVGDGSQRAALERWAVSERATGVAFAGWAHDVAAELSMAGMLLAPTPSEGLGLAVLEAMAAGVPVVAAAAGGHLETAGRVPDAPLFGPGDVADGASAIRKLASDAERQRLSDAARRLVVDYFSVEDHVGQLLSEYAHVARHAMLRTGTAVNAG